MLSGNGNDHWESLKNNVPGTKKAKPPAGGRGRRLKPELVGRGRESRLKSGNSSRRERPAMTVNQKVGTVGNGQGKGTDTRTIQIH